MRFLQSNKKKHRINPRPEAEAEKKQFRTQPPITSMIYKAGEYGFLI
jgi:hypothetical protein